MRKYFGALTIKEAAAIIGKSQQFLRLCLQRKLIPGIALKMPNRKRYTYLITIKDLEEFTGIKLETKENEKSAYQAGKLNDKHIA